VEGAFAKKFSGAGEDSAVGTCARLQSRACGDLRSRRPHSSLISGLLGLERISKRKDSHCARGEAADRLKSRTRTRAAVKREAEEDLGQAFRICDDFDSNPQGAIILLAGRCADRRAAERKA
jgi:hypothetical protein